MISLLWIIPFYGQERKFDTVIIKRQNYSNDYEVDTLLVQKDAMRSNQVLVGTMLLKDSRKLSRLSLNGVEALSFKMIDTCDEGREEESSGDETLEEDILVFNASNRYTKLHENITRIWRKDNLLFIDVQLVSNCCNDFLGEADVRGDMIQLGYIDYGGNCSCHCTYHLRYEFDITNIDANKDLKYIGFTEENRRKIPRL
ncbi:hypothetical protein D1818_01075 [Aquimarina sp. BL5]|nr:hypothetical protein D1818_01075 [Aquimarina sp. BL5]RKN04374.1 hypothetical protein D7036_12320 [Aquimarina sp. BL5]